MTALVFAPKPVSCFLHDQVVLLPRHSVIVLEGNPQRLLPLAQLLQNDLKNFQQLYWDITAAVLSKDSKNFYITLRAHSAESASQSYRLSITSQSLQITAGDEAGLFYGLMTLRQILRQTKRELPLCEIEDHPDFPVRGVMLDVSRDKVPLLSTLFALIEHLAEWKINHLQLYTEHTFAYLNHQAVWCQSSPYTGEDMLLLDQYCRERFIDLVPNQNSFGHLHRWLTLPQYQHLAECPGGFQWPWGEFNPEPFSLSAVNPHSLELLDELYAELLPHFSSSYFNVGCDETFDLGQGHSQKACEAQGKGRVYLDFLLKIQQLVRRHGRTMLFWGDIIIEHPELIAELPQKIIVLEWGYEADHPFEKHGAQFQKSGIPFYVCPGTSSWNSIAGRTDNCLGNLRSATRYGLQYGAAGVLNTDWGDRGHWQPLPVSYLGLLAGASLSWCYQTNQQEDFKQALDLHVFQDTAKIMGTLCFDLGNVYQEVGHLMKNSSALFHVLYQHPAHSIFQKVTLAGLRNTEALIQRLLEKLPQACMQREDAALIHQEMTLVGQLLLYACHRGQGVLAANLKDKMAQGKLAQEIQSILGNFREVWLARNRQGGLQDSIKVLEQREVEHLQKDLSARRIF